MKLDDKGLLVVLSGPSGVGKGTVRESLFKREDHDLVYSVSMTTRLPRSNEVDGKDYYFVTKEEFEKGIKENRFLEYAKFINNYYGTPLDKVQKQLAEGHEVVLEIEVQGAMQVRKRMPEAILIFIAPPSMAALYDRLHIRGTESEVEVKERYDKACREVVMADFYDYIVVNDTVENAADKIMAIVRAEHAKTCRCIEKYNEIIKDRRVKRWAKIEMELDIQQLTN